MIILSLLLSVTLSCGGPDGPDTPGGETSDPVKLQVIEGMPSVNTMNTHVGQEKWSVLQPMYRYFTKVQHTFLTELVPDSSTDQKTAVYPRIKRMANGRYLMLYHGGKLGTRCFFTTSDDLKHWETPQLLFGPERVTVGGISDWRRYVNPDAVVMPDGEIIAVFSYRDTDNYPKGIGGGLVLRRSLDNGKTWTAPEHIYTGTNWEPYLLLLPDGRLHCYFTDATPMTRNSGTSVLVSSDRGKTWSDKIRCSRIYKYEYDGPNTEYTGEKIFTDQMPCFRVLNDGKTLFGFLEDRLEEPESILGTSYYMMSAVYNDGLDWKPLGEVTPGPERRQSLVLIGAAGYVSTFPSGEVAISCNIDMLFSLKLGDATATDFGSWKEGWLQPFPDKGYWGCTEVLDGNRILSANSCSVDGLQLGMFWLNHRIDAPKLNVTLDGNGGEWSLGHGALYVGNKEGGEAMIRAARNGDNLYLIVDRRGKKPVTLQLSFGQGRIVQIKIDEEGNVVSDNTKVQGKSREGKADDKSTGTVTEIAIPLSETGIQGASSGTLVCIYASIAGTNGPVPFSFADPDKPDTWQRIALR